MEQQIMSQLDFLAQEITRLADHFATINDELGTVVVKVAVLENQMAEVLWLQKLLLGTMIVAIVGAVLGLIIKKKNGKS